MNVKKWGENEKKVHIEEIQELERELWRGGAGRWELGFVGIKKCLEAFHMEVWPLKSMKLGRKIASKRQNSEKCINLQEVQHQAFAA